MKYGEIFGNDHVEVNILKCKVFYKTLLDVKNKDRTKKLIK